MDSYEFTMHTAMCTLADAAGGKGRHQYIHTYSVLQGTRLGNTLKYAFTRLYTDIDTYIIWCGGTFMASRTQENAASL
jgi:hypothetical protein